MRIVIHTLYPDTIRLIIEHEELLCRSITTQSDGSLLVSVKGEESYREWARYLAAWTEGSVIFGSHIDRS